MVAEAELVRENIETLQEYIHLLEKIRRVLFGFGLGARGKAVLETIDQKIGWLTQVFAGAAGFGIFVFGLGLGRTVARSPGLLALVFVAAGLLGAGTVVFIFYLARRRVADQEIKKAQIEIYRLEDRLKE